MANYGTDEAPPSYEDTAAMIGQEPHPHPGVNTNFGPIPSEPLPSYEDTAAMIGRQPPPQPGVNTDCGPIPSEPPPKYYNPPVPPQGPGYGHSYPRQAETYPDTQGYGTVHHTVIINSPSSWGTLPTTCSCPYCQAFITTTVSKSAGALTWLTARRCCILGCWLGCCLIPFCVSELQDTEHRCPNCGRHIGTHQKQCQEFLREIDYK